jgi:hypothetical protein
MGMRFVRAWLLFVVTAGATQACNAGPAESPSCDGALSSDGACQDDVGLYYQPCSGKVVAPIPALDCPTRGCSGPSAYAVCNGKEWGPCACAIPPGYEVVDAGFFGPEGGSEGGAATDEGSPSPG